LGLQLVLPASLVFPTEEAIEKTLRWSKYLKQHKKITAKLSVIPRPVEPYMRYDSHGQTQRQTTAILSEQQMACSVRATEENQPR
jgi:hypothetical protein